MCSLPLVHQQLLVRLLERGDHQLHPIIISELIAVWIHEKRERKMIRILLITTIVARPTGLNRKTSYCKWMETTPVKIPPTIRFAAQLNNDTCPICYHYFATVKAKRKTHEGKYLRQQHSGISRSLLLAHKHFTYNSGDNETTHAHKHSGISRSLLLGWDNEDNTRTQTTHAHKHSGISRSLLLGWDNETTHAHKHPGISRSLLLGWDNEDNTRTQTFWHIQISTTGLRQRDNTRTQTFWHIQISTTGLRQRGQHTHTNISHIQISTTGLRQRGQHTHTNISHIQISTTGLRQRGQHTHTNISHITDLYYWVGITRQHTQTFNIYYPNTLVPHPSTILDDVNNFVPLSGQIGHFEFFEGLYEGYWEHASLTVIWTHSTMFRLFLERLHIALRPL